MLRFDDSIHLHVGYDEDGYDLEGIFFKVENEDIWCLFCDAKEIKQTNLYPYTQDFGYLVGLFSLKKEALSYELGLHLFQQFLLLEKII